MGEGDDVVAVVAVEVSGEECFAVEAEEVVPLDGGAGEGGAGGGGDVDVVEGALGEGDDVVASVTGEVRRRTRQVLTTGATAGVDQRDVVVPVPVWTGVGVVVAGDLVVRLDRGAVLRQAVLVAQVAGQRGRRPVHRVGEPGRVVDVALVFDAHGVRVARPRVVGGVALAHHLGDLAVAGLHDVVRAHPGRRVLEPADRAGVRALGHVDDHGGDPRGPAGRVVAAVRGDPPGRRVLRHRRRDDARGGRSGGGDAGVPAEFRLDPLRRDPYGGRADAGVQEVVDVVGVQACRRVVDGVRVPRDHRIPGGDPVPVGGGQPLGVGEVPQESRAASDVGRGHRPERGHRLPGQFGRPLQGALAGVADQVHDAVAVGLAGAALVPVEPGLAVADGDQQVLRDVELTGRTGEGRVERAGGGGRGGGRCDGAQQRCREDGGDAPAPGDSGGWHGGLPFAVQRVVSPLRPK